MVTELTFAEPIHRLRPRTQLVQRGSALLLRLGQRSAKLEPFDDAMKYFLDLIASGGTRVQLRERFLEIWDQGYLPRVERCLDQLLRAGFIEQVNLAHHLEPMDVLRFDRLLHFFSEYETENFSRFDYLTRLRQARVGIIGTGGLGSWIIYNLLCLGVGSLRLIDGDRVEASNLNRSILYTEEDIGDLKVQAAARAVARFAPRTQVEGHNVFVSGPGMLLPYLDNLDLVIGTADQPQWLIREWIAGACQQAGVSVIQASGLRVGPFHIPGESSCAMCDWMQIVEHNPHYPGVVAAQRQLPRPQSGSISALGTITAGVLSMEVFRYLAGHVSPMTINAVWEMHKDFAALMHPVPFHSSCPVCGGKMG